MTLYFHIIVIFLVKKDFFTVCYADFVPGSGPQFYFVFRENELIGYNFLIGDTKKYKAFPWLAISNMDEQKLTVCEELMKIQIAFFEELGMQKIADHCVRIMEDYRKGIGKRKESDCR